MTKSYHDSLASDVQKNACLRSKIVNHLALGVGVGGFSQDYIGIGYCGIEGDYSFIYDPEILNHSPGPVLFLFREDWGVTWQSGEDQ